MEAEALDFFEALFLLEFPLLEERPDFMVRLQGVGEHLGKVALGEEQPTDNEVSAIMMARVLKNSHLPPCVDQAETEMCED